MRRKKTILGWIGVVITLLISGFWSYWGTFENFHEGWYLPSFWENMSLFFVQYMSFTIIFVVLAIVALKWKKLGLILHLILGAVSYWFFSGANFTVRGLLIVIPFVILGLIYYYGDPHPKKWANRLIIIIPLIIVLAISIPQGIKVSKRISDGDLGIKIVSGKGVTLAWAPRGPGWPDDGRSWEAAQEICKFLSEDGMTIMETEQNIWRLPTVDEAVRSMMLHGENSGGIWQAIEEKATYEQRPDKESPLWDVHAKTIYYWTNDTVIEDEERAYIIVYHGGVFKRKKTNQQDYLSFRAVKEVDQF